MNLTDLSITYIRPLINTVLLMIAAGQEEDNNTWNALEWEE